MIRSNGGEQRPRGWKVPIAMLAASAAFVGGGQALAPAPAFATISDYEGCSVFGMDWVNCIVQEDGGGGDGGSGSADGGGSGSTGGSDSTVTATPIPNNGEVETVEITETKVQVPVGTQADSPSTDGREPGESPGGQSGAKKRIPRCTRVKADQNGKKPLCQEPNRVCVLSNNKVLRVYTAKECDDAELELERKTLAEANLPGICKNLNLVIKSTDAKIQKWINSPPLENLPPQDDPDLMEDLKTAIRTRVGKVVRENLDARDRWHELGCKPSLLQP